VEIKDPDLVPKLAEFERQYMIGQYKFGVLHAQCDHTDENDMFSNQAHEASDDFQKFLSLLGKTVKLKGWNKFRGGLNIRDDSTGTHSVYTCLDERGCDFVEPDEESDSEAEDSNKDDAKADLVKREIMFHVSTMLPYQENDLQRVERKRHLGNDIVVVVFRENPQDDTRTFESFDPGCVASQFNHIFVCVSVDAEATQETGKTHYRVAIAMKGGTVPFSPFLPCSPVFEHGPAFRKFLLTKLVNAERSCIWHAPDFKLKMQRTAKTLLGDMCETFIPHARSRNKDIEKTERKESESLSITGPDPNQVRHVGSGISGLQALTDSGESRKDSKPALDGRQLKYAACSLSEVAAKLAEAEREASALDMLVKMYQNDPAGLKEAQANHDNAQAEVNALRAVQKSKQEMEAAVSSAGGDNNTHDSSANRPLGPVPDLPDSAGEEEEDDSAFAIYQQLVADLKPQTTGSSKEPHHTRASREGKLVVNVPPNVVDLAREESKKREHEQSVWLSKSRCMRVDTLTPGEGQDTHIQNLVHRYRKSETGGVLCQAFRSSDKVLSVQHLFASRKDHDRYDWTKWDAVLAQVRAGSGETDTYSELMEL
jgi:Rap/ran-GAP